MPANATQMHYDTREPCKTCPYRRDVPIGTWHREEFQNLRAQNSRDFGEQFGCHATRKAARGPSVCGGWLLDQRNHGVPSLSLRMTLMSNPEALAAFDEVTDGGHDCYESVAEMIEANEEALDAEGA